MSFNIEIASKPRISLRLTFSLLSAVGGVLGNVKLNTPSIAAAPASPNTGTPIMATSAQVATASAAPAAAPTIINNYYGASGEQGGAVPNGVSPGIGMNDSGTAVFQDLRIRSLA